MARTETDLKQTLRRTLQQLAEARRTVTYQELAFSVEMPPPHRIHRLTLLLEALMEEDQRAGRPLLAALAVSRARQGVPAPGFFQKLTELGRYEGPDRGPQAAAAHGRELAAAWDYWARG